MNTHRSLVTAGFVVALLALPGSALAQTRARPTAATPRSTSPAPAAAPAPAAPSPAAEPPFEEQRLWRLGGAIGYENDSGADLTGPRLQIELERDLVPLGERGRLSFVTLGAWALGMDSQSASVPGLTVKTEVTRHLFELVPGLRASVALQRRLHLFAEMGIGAGWFTAETKISTWVGLGLPTPPVRSTTSDTVGVLRLGAGATFKINDRFRVGVELPTFSWRFGAATQRAFSLSAVGAFTL